MPLPSLTLTRSARFAKRDPQQIRAQRDAAASRRRHGHSRLATELLNAPDHRADPSRFSEFRAECAKDCGVAYVAIEEGIYDYERKSPRAKADSGMVRRRVTGESIVRENEVYLRQIAQSAPVVMDADTETEIVDLYVLQKVAQVRYPQTATTS